MPSGKEPRVQQGNGEAVVMASVSQCRKAGKILRVSSVGVRPNGRSLKQSGKLERR